MKNKILSLLGFATKAGKLGFGFEAAREALRDKKSKIVLIASDISEKSLKKIVTSTAFYGVEHRRSEKTMAELSDALGVTCNVAAVAVKKSTFVNLF